MCLFAFLASVPLVLAAPAPAPAPAPVAVPAPVPIPLPNPQGLVTNPITGILGSLIQGRVSLGSFTSAVPAIISDTAQLVDASVPVLEAVANGTITGTDTPALVQKLFQAVKPAATPTSNANSAPPTEQNILTNVLTLVLNGFKSSDIQAVINGASLFTNTTTNVNRPVPIFKTFYNTIPGNAPFSVPESQLRAAIYIPPGFTWGQKQPILMSPGTGATGGINFESIISKLLSQTSFADLVYFNIPNALLSDAQVNVEYVAYALQYLKATSNKNPAIVTWFQRSLNAQWAFKYWPSVRKIVTDHIAISPDYHSTVLAYLLCPSFALGKSIACVPSIIQQEYNSQFVARLRSNG